MTTKFTTLDETLYPYFRDIAVREDALLIELRELTANREDARMQISPEQGQLMTLLTSMVSLPRKKSGYSAIEIGTFTGYSGICIARGLVDGAKLLTCDVNVETVRIAESYALKAGLDQTIDTVVGPALVALEDLCDQGVQDVDFIFIDADKENYQRYYEKALTLLRVGGIVCVDNVLWGGMVADPTDQSVDTVAIREVNQTIAQDTRVCAAVVPISDGLTIARKL